MSAFSPKTYQGQVLDSVEAYFKACHELPLPSIAFTATTELAFGMLARFRPSGVMELSATPDLERRPSKVLHSVSAAELKAEEVISLPVVLETEPGWFQQAQSSDDAASRVAVTDQYAFEFHAQTYSPSRDYDGRFGHFDFREHFYGRVGGFDSKEEFECACWRDIQAQQGRIQLWVRNFVRREGCSFFLQKANGGFYPDFLCQLPGSADQSGTILAVESEGAVRWAGAEKDRLIGGLWANLSGGRCRFVMVKDKRWEGVEEKLHPSLVRQH